MLDAYVTGINERRYSDSFALLSPDNPTAKKGVQAWIDAESSTQIRDARLRSVSDGPTGTVNGAARCRSTSSGCTACITSRTARSVVTVGASEAVAAAMAAIVDPGDEVILHEPSYVAYLPAILFNGGMPVFVPTIGGAPVRARPGGG